MLWIHRFGCPIDLRSTFSFIRGDSADRNSDDLFYKVSLVVASSPLVSDLVEIVEAKSV